MKQTAVEWFQEQIIKIVNGTCELSESQIFLKAKAMEKEDLESAYFCGSCDRMNDEGSFEQYYKETYERQDNKH